MNMLNDVTPGKNNPMYQIVLIVTHQVSYKDPNEDVTAEDACQQMKDLQGKIIQSEVDRHYPIKKLNLWLTAYHAGQIDFCN